MKTVHSEVVKKISETFQDLAGSTLDNSRVPATESGETEEGSLVFLFLEEELEVRGIHDLAQLPIGGEKTVVQFVNNLPADPVLFAVLQKLEFTECIPFPIVSETHARVKLQYMSRKRAVTCPYLTGCGYHCLTDHSTHQNGVYDLGDLIYPTVIGFALPQNLNCSRIGKIYDTFRVFRSPSHYASVRHQELMIPLLSSIGKKWHAEPKAGYNIGHTKSYGDIAFTFVREYRQFMLSISNFPSVPLHSSFMEKLKEITVDHQTRHNSEKDTEWEEFFRNYGTHVITSATGGGRIIVTILENHLKNFSGVNDLSRRERVLEVEQAIAKVLDGVDAKASTENSINPVSEGTFSENGRALLISSIRLEGGDPSFESLDLTTCHKVGEKQDVISRWSQTLQFFPMMLDSAISVEPIANVLGRNGLHEEAKLLDLATQRIFGKSFYSFRHSKGEGRSWSWGLRSGNPS